MPPLRGLILLRRIQGIPGPRFPTSADVHFGAPQAVTYGKSLDFCGVALVTAHAVVSKGGEDDHAH
jgi:hypothetical protein